MAQAHATRRGRPICVAGPDFDCLPRGVPVQRLASTVAITLAPVTLVFRAVVPVATVPVTVRRAQSASAPLALRVMFPPTVAGPGGRRCFGAGGRLGKPPTPTRPDERAVLEDSIRALEGNLQAVVDDVGPCSARVRSAKKQERRHPEGRRARACRGAGPAGCALRSRQTAACRSKARRR